MTIEVGDVVRYHTRRYSRSPMVPYTLRGDIVKVSAKMAVVTWRMEGRQIAVWRRGAFRPVLPTGRFAHHNLELIERKPGPW